ncbi:hypothetical protein QQS21_010408 [Conoideocrella luteorostrata]|uniref:Enterotoxin n=1 Tax=Conoideocrella luteorostrata TaxID=1105319 RepID=A0AAJ0FU76_9HYPO|nr:hypothetical protein QQS21_010408 [Conoideocrella luteorostrata]
MADHQYFYLISSRKMDTPANFRLEGGINEYEDADPPPDEAWGYNNAEEGGFTLVTNNLKEAKHDFFQSFQRGWIYRITASPNMVPRVSSDGLHPGYTHAALGGVLWSQVQAYAPIDMSWGDSQEFHWQDNLDYDPRWRFYGANGVQPLLSGEYHIRDTTLRNLAREFMNDLTSPEPGFLDADKLKNLRELLDWNPESEPKRDFPLIRHRQPPSLTSATLRGFDWSTVDIPAHMRMVMKDGIPTSADCAKIIRKVIRTHSESISKQQQQQHRRDNNEKAKQGDECEKLASTIKEQDKQANNHLPTSAHGTNYTAHDVKIVYHADFLWPEEAKKQGGFIPASKTPPSATPDAEIEITNFLIPTYLSFGAAAGQAARISSNKTKGFAGVVYVVHATPNIISSGNRSAAVGGIRWSQVMGWMQVPQQYSPPEYNATWNNSSSRRQHFEEAFKENKDLFQQNKDYAVNKFKQYKTTTIVQQNMSTLHDLELFMNQNGQAVDWKGTFPLFQASSTAQSDKSTEAKAKNAIPTPHEPSAWEKIEKYVKSHAIAIALLPAAVALNFIPGLGEVADAAELAALCTESVEGVEMAEMSSSLTEVGSGVARVLQQAAKLKVA